MFFIGTFRGAMNTKGIEKSLKILQQSLEEHASQDTGKEGLFSHKTRAFIFHMLSKSECFQERMDWWLNESICRKCAANLHERDSELKNFPCSYRTLHHWESQGLIECLRETKKGWRKFNLLECVWLHVISELREFGLSLDKIAAVKPLFFENYSDDIPIPLMEYYIGAALGWYEPVYLVVFKEGGSVPLNYDQLQTAHRDYQLTHCIQLNINEILKRTGTSLYVPPKYPVELDLPLEMLHLLLLIQMKEFKTVTVHQKNGSIARIEASKDCKPGDQIGEILRSHDFQEIHVIEKGGKVVSIRQKISVKPEKLGANLATINK